MELDEELLIAYTKQEDKLPLINFQMSAGLACMDGSALVSPWRYITEMKQYDTCPQEVTTGQIHDPRYRSAAAEGLFEIREWDVMEDNGIAKVYEY